jgi:hypothetical protein
MKISISFFFAFSENLVFSDHKNRYTLLKNSNQKFVNFTIKVLFFDYPLAKFLTFHRAASDVCSMTQCDLSICKHYENHSFVWVELGF